MNYYQHGTYLTVNHAHAALFGVYGNLAIAAMLFCGRGNISAHRWNSRMLHISFWSLNIGLLMMVMMDLFPVGVHQLIAAMTEGYAYARSQVFLEGDTFQFFTWMRSFGVILFILVGVFPLVWFMEVACSCFGSSISLSSSTRPGCPAAGTCPGAILA